jgi:hypothetical protein
VDQIGGPEPRTENGCGAYDFRITVHVKCAAGEVRRVPRQARCALSSCRALGPRLVASGSRTLHDWCGLRRRAAPTDTSGHTLRHCTLGPQDRDPRACRFASLCHGAALPQQDAKMILSFELCAYISPGCTLSHRSPAVCSTHSSNSRGRRTLYFNVGLAPRETVHSPSLSAPDHDLAARAAARSASS